MKYRKMLTSLPKPPGAPIPTAHGPRDWQKDMQDALRGRDALLQFLELNPTEAPESLLENPKFPILVPRGFARRMRPKDWRDPLLAQVLALSRENLRVDDFSDDAVGDLASQVVPGVLHKYASRVLMMISAQCAIHCRYCFRREFPYGDLPRGKDGHEDAWSYLENAEGVDEIVFSGGDPLFLDNKRLEGILDHAASLPRIRTLRFHTRLPIVLPSRIDSGLVNMLAKAGDTRAVVMVVHANHPNELDETTRMAAQALRRAGVLLLNQTVLLHGINDDADTLADLSRALVAQGILPYYLHQLDRVSGTAHFETPESHGLELIASLREKLPGYAVPAYVRELAGEKHKRPLT